MADLGLEEALARVKTTILENPISETARQNVEDELQSVLKKTSVLQGYSAKDFSRLTELNVLAVGYARKGIGNLKLLSALSGVVPQSLDAEILFPVVDEDGKRRLWYYTDMMSYVQIVAAVGGESSAYAILVKFGRYSFFITGLMPDILKMAERKKVIDIPYYEWAGSMALKLAASNPAAKSEESSALEELASDFTRFRKILNEVGALVGTAARQTFFDNILETYGISGKYGIQKGPLKEKKQHEHRIGGIPLFKQDDVGEIGKASPN